MFSFFVRTIRVFVIWIAASVTITVFGQLNPTDLPKNFSIFNLKSWKMDASVSIPTNSNGAIVLYSTSPQIVQLQDNKIYQRGMILNNAKVLTDLDIGASEFSIKGLIANTKYYISIYTYRKVSNTEIYYNRSSFNTDFTTPGGNIGNYYQGLSTSDPSFLTKLSAHLQYKIQDNHYGLFFNPLSHEFFVKDTFVDDLTKYFVVCEYSDIKTLFTDNFSYTNTNFNREHILAKNWMNFRSVSQNDLLHGFNEGADMHNLAMTDGTVNGKRSFFPLDSVVGKIENLGLAKVGINDLDSQAFEPQANFKGNAARAMMYQMVTYNGLMGANWGLNNLQSKGKQQKQSIIKQWAKQDPVDNYEIARHEAIYSIQGNRNPFIDFPEWVDCIDFANISQLATCKEIPSTGVGIISKNSDWDVTFGYNHPNLIISLYYDRVEPLKLEIYDLKGSQIYHSNHLLGTGFQQIAIAPQMSSGVFLIKAYTAHRQFSGKISINP